MIAIPFSSMDAITGGVALKAFTIVWTGFTLLWFMQIFPKHMAATNPDRYLGITQSSFFPLVEIVRQIGIYTAGVWVARPCSAGSIGTPSRASRRRPLHVAAASLAEAWAALVPERAPATRRSPDDE